MPPAREVGTSLACSGASEADPPTGHAEAVVDDDWPPSAQAQQASVETAPLPYVAWQVGQSVSGTGGTVGHEATTGKPQGNQVFPAAAPADVYVAVDGQGGQVGEDGCVVAVPVAGAALAPPTFGQAQADSVGSESCPSQVEDAGAEGSEDTQEVPSYDGLQVADALGNKPRYVNYSLLPHTQDTDIPPATTNANHNNDDAQLRNSAVRNCVHLLPPHKTVA